MHHVRDASELPVPAQVVVATVRSVMGFEALWRSWFVMFTTMLNLPINETPPASKKDTVTRTMFELAKDSNSKYMGFPS